MSAEPDGKSPASDPGATRELLQSLREQVDAERVSLEVQLDAIRAARSDGSADDEHDPEGSTLSSDWSYLRGLARSLDAHREEIDGAAARLLHGTYGLCVSCAIAIPLGRLEARPSAEYCIDCARR